MSKELHLAVEIEVQCSVHLIYIFSYHPLSCHVHSHVNLSLKSCVFILHCRSMHAFMLITVDNTNNVTVLF